MPTDVTTGQRVTTDQRGGPFVRIFNTTVDIGAFEFQNQPPRITSNSGGATASVNVPENTTVVTDVDATDPDSPGATLTFSISGGSDAAKFAINAATGVLTFVTPPNFETPTDSNTDNIYEVTVQVSDGSLTDTQTLSVTVTDVLAPTVTQFRIQKDARGKKVTDLLITFSVDVSGAAARANYVLTALGSRPKPLVISAATYDGATHTARLHLLKPLALKKLATTQLKVRGDGTITDLALQNLDGDANSTSGGDFVRTLNQGVIASVVVDRLLETDRTAR